MENLKILVTRVCRSNCLCPLRLQSTKPLQRPREKPIVRPNLFQDGGIVLLTIPVTTFGLGVWQIFRRQRKIEMIQKLEEQTSGNPVSLPSMLNEIDDLEYHSVKVRGTFDHSKTIKIGPRQNLHKEYYRRGGGEGGGIISGGRQSGFWVVTPFKLSDRNATILINRGWIPKGEDMESFLKPETKPEGEVEIVGVVRRSESKKMFVPKNEPAKNSWLHRDIDMIARHLGTVPVYIDANLQSTVPGGPIGGQTKVKLYNDHFSYIITWFSLSAITFYGWYRRYWRPASSKMLHEIYRKEKGLKR